MNSQAPSIEPGATRWAPLGLFLLLLVVYCANVRPIPSDDALPSRILPLSILEEGDLRLDEVQGRHYAVVEGTDGHRYSRYPILTPLMALPLYAAFDLAGADFGNPMAPLSLTALVAKLAAAIMGAGSGLFVFLAVRTRYNPPAAWLSALCYGLGTSVWGGSQDLYQHPAALLLLSIAMYLLVREERRLLWGVGVALALACEARPPVAIIACLLGVHVIVSYGLRTALARLAFPALLIAFIGSIYRFQAFGQPLATGYGREAIAGWTSPLLAGFAGLLVSPSKGLLVLSPIVLLAAWGTVRATRGPSSCLPRFAGLAALCYLLVMARWHIWYGGFSYGSRMSLEILPLIFIFLPAGLPRGSRWKKTLVIGPLLAWSIAIQLIGIYGVDFSWHRKFDKGPEKRAWLWSLKDCQPLWYLRRNCWYQGWLRSDPPGVRIIRFGDCDSGPS